MHNHAPSACAALTRGGVTAAYTFKHSGANIGVFPDNRGVAAAQFKGNNSTWSI
jgi:hypothetical protein